jgi:hypothetical protein
MKISSLINDCGKEHSPYMGNLVNHLPMGQLALYKMTEDLDKVKKFTESYLSKARINPVKEDYIKISSIEGYLGNRELYKPCLSLVKREIEKRGIVEFTKHILNTYPLGMSSGLFHTTIRVAYAVEGEKIDGNLKEEIIRALAYYITAYREAELLIRKIDGGNIIQETEKLIENPHIKQLLSSKDSLGQKMKVLYESEEYSKYGFIIEGSEEQKIRSFLNLLLPAYYNSDNIVILHCITGLHAVLVLKDYYNDFSKILDILFTCILTHLLTVENLDFEELKNEEIISSWGDIFEKASSSSDVHTLKLTYTCSELDKLYGMPELKQIALRRIK